MVVISSYSFITKDFSYSSLTSLLLGIFIATIGIEELRNKEKNPWGLFYIFVSLLVIVMAIFSF
ncbi:DUF3953 domain-containing protein [Ureibacillus thermophilus]|uniref:DUF3953 domain-containing protein n=1 Tax=Ureibacillus thermophilus TaxID=367743 RepID=UPI001FEBF7FA|nr:DUF3953 domain-containing protein [Ureibacillus thermophilus]